MKLPPMRSGTAARGHLPLHRCRADLRAVEEQAQRGAVVGDGDVRPLAEGQVVRGGHLLGAADAGDSAGPAAVGRRVQGVGVGAAPELGEDGALPATGLRLDPGLEGHPPSQVQRGVVGHRQPGARAVEVEPLAELALHAAHAVPDRAVALAREVAELQTLGGRLVEAVGGDEALLGGRCRRSPGGGGDQEADEQGHHHQAERATRTSNGRDPTVSWGTRRAEATGRVRFCVVSCGSPSLARGATGRHTAPPNLRCQPGASPRGGRFAVRRT